MEADPIVEHAMEGDTVHLEDAESDVVYVGRVFNDENEAYHAYNCYALTKVFRVRNGKTSKFITDGQT